MDEIIYNSLMIYFNTLSKLGYLSYDKVYKLLYLICIRDFVYNDWRGYITQDDYRVIEHSLYCVFGTTCLVPYPQFCKINSMNKLYLGNITELASIVNTYKNEIDDYQESITEDFSNLDSKVNTFTQQITAKVDNYKDEIDASEAQYKEAIQEIVDNFNEEMNTKVDNYQKNTVSTIQSYQDSVNDKMQQYYNNMQSSFNEYKVTVDNNIVTINNKINTINSDLTNIKATKVIKGNTQETEIPDISI